MYGSILGVSFVSFLFDNNRSVLFWLFNMLSLEKDWSVFWSVSIGCLCYPLNRSGENGCRVSEAGQ